MKTILLCKIILKKIIEALKKKSIEESVDFVLTNHFKFLTVNIIKIIDF